MNERVKQRVAKGLTQTEAARRASVSLATWRRWEADPSSVREKTASKCEQMLVGGVAAGMGDAALRGVLTAWGDSPRLTPRQAWALSATLGTWSDLYLKPWIAEPRDPLHDVSPFCQFDLRVLVLVGENRAWVEGVRRRCDVLAEEIEQGVLPFDRPGPFIDEVLIAAALTEAPDMLEDEIELFEGIPPRAAATDDEEYLLGDDEWGLVSDMFDNDCRWGEWEIPVRDGHPLLPALLLARPPHTWFDPAPPDFDESLAACLRRMAGTESAGAASPKQSAVTNVDHDYGC